MREELQLFGYVIFRQFFEEPDAPPVVLTEIGWDSPEEVLVYVNACASMAHEDEMFVVLPESAAPYWFINKRGDANLVIGQLDSMLRGLCSLLHKNKTTVWANAMLQEWMQNSPPDPKMN